VRFVHRRDADEALAKMEGAEVDGQHLKIQYAMERRPDNPRRYYEQTRGVRGDAYGSGGRDPYGGGGGGDGGYSGIARRCVVVVETAVHCKLCSSARVDEMSCYAYAMMRFTVLCAVALLLLLQWLHGGLCYLTPLCDVHKLLLA
jgi:hypothetical protein